MLLETIIQNLAMLLLRAGIAEIMSAFVTTLSMNTRRLEVKHVVLPSLTSMARLHTLVSDYGEETTGG